MDLGCAAMVGNGYYLDCRVASAVNDRIGKASQDVSPGADDVRRPRLWKLLYLRDRVIQFLHERGGGGRTSLLVPPSYGRASAIDSS